MTSSGTVTLKPLKNQHIKWQNPFFSHSHSDDFSFDYRRNRRKRKKRNNKSTATSNQDWIVYFNYKLRRKCLLNVLSRREPQCKNERQILIWTFTNGRDKNRKYHFVQGVRRATHCGETTFEWEDALRIKHILAIFGNVVIFPIN